MLLRRLFYLCLSGLFSNAVHAVELYDLTDLGPIVYNSAQELQGLKLDINNSGVVVGWARAVNRFSPIKAFTWDATHGRQFLNNDMQRDDAAFSINNSNQITGWISTGGKHQAVLWTFNSAAWVEMALNIANSDSSEAVSIDDTDNLAGNYVDGTGVSHGFLLSTSTLQPTPLNDELLDTNVSQANGGWMIGDRSIAQGQVNAVLVRGINDSVVLGNLGSGDFFSTASGLNSSSVVGGSFTDQVPCTNICFPVAHGFVWNQINGMSDLLPNDALSSWANDINESGKIVGWRTRLPSSIAVLWGDNKTPLNLNALTTNLGNWSLERAQAINSAGQIVGIGKIAGETHAFVLTPNGLTASSSDLAIALASSPVSKATRRDTTVETLSLEITNNGPDDAHGVEFKATIPQGLQIENVQLSGGSCVYLENVGCTVDSLKVDETIVATVQVKALDAASYDIDFEVTSTGIDGGLIDDQNLKASVNLVLGATPQLDESDSTDLQGEAPEDNTDAGSNQNLLSSLDLDLLLVFGLLLVTRRYMNGRVDDTSSTQKSS